MTNPFGLQEAIDLIRNTEKEKLDELLFNKQLIDFFNGLNHTGTDILRDMLGEDKGLAAYRLVLVSVEMVLVQEASEHPELVDELSYLMTSSVFDKAILLAMKATLGLSVVEELH